MNLWVQLVNYLVNYWWTNKNFHNTFMLKKKRLIKNFKSYKDKYGNCLKSMTKAEAAVRRLGRPTFVNAPDQRIGNKKF